MRIATVTFILIVSTIKTFSQGSIILNNGDKIDFIKFKEKQDQLIVKKRNKEKIIINIENVKGYFNDNQNLFFYKKENIDNSSQPYKSVKEYQFLTIETEGKINLYKRSITTTRYEYSFNPINSIPGTQSIITTETDYFLEKGNMFHQILKKSSLTNNNKRNLSSLRSFVSDNLNIASMIDKNFKVNAKNLIKIIREYNLAEHNKDFNLANGDKGSLIFYRTGKNVSNSLVDLIKHSKNSVEDMLISVNDTTYTLEEYAKIEIPIIGLTKICLGEQKEFCELISANQHFPLYFELSQEKKSKTFSIERKNLEEANFVLSKITEMNDRFPNRK